MLEIEKYLTISYIPHSSGSETQITSERFESQPTFEESLLEGETTDHKH